MTWQKALLHYLYAHELFFIDEIDRLQTRPDLVTGFPADSFADGGWLFMAAEQASSDWNLARLMGDPQLALAAVDLLPAAETSLLVPEEAADLFAGRYKRQPDLIFFASALSLPDNLDQGAKLPPYFTVEARTVEGYTSFYLLADNQVQGYVKTIRSSKNFAEVYIELKPPIRGQGLAPKLLRHAMAQVHRCQQRLFYAVAANNAPSLATARRAGLKQVFSLCRFIS